MTHTATYLGASPTKNMKYRLQISCNERKLVDEYSKPEYDVIVERDVMVGMRDGVHLATDVYHPARGSRRVSGEFPCILERTPYWKNDPKRVQLNGEWFCRRGYVVVIQDSRGMFNSEGVFHKYANMAEDGYDTVEWIAEQPWSNGKVGTMGTSYMAHTQLSLACLNPPHLRAMIMNEGGQSSAYRTGVRNGGAFMFYQLEWAWNSAPKTNEAINDTVIAKAFQATDPFDYVDPTKGPLKRGETPLRFVPNFEEWYFDLLTKSDYGDFWEKPELCAERFYDQMSDVPTLIIGGWYDLYSQTVCENYIGLSSRKKGPIRLIVGPWTHGSHANLALSHNGDVDFGGEAPLNGNLDRDYDHLRLRWFDQWLKGKDMGLEDEAPVKIFVMGGGDGLRGGASGKLNHGGHWRDEREWPLKRTRYVSYYLRAGGILSKEPPNERDSYTAYSYDPRHPVPTVGGNFFTIHGPSGAFDQISRKAYIGCDPPYLPLATRDDVLVFKTPLLRQRVEVTGDIEVELWASSSAVDTDFTAKLIDIHPPNVDYPNGLAMILSDGILRARYRSSWTEPELVERGRIYSFKVRLNPTSNVFDVGHQIRLDVSSSNYPKYDINPNTGEPLGMSRRF